MYANDRRWALTLVAILWIVTLFTLYMIWPLIPDGNVRIVASVAAALVLIFNTASISAMVKHYAEDKDFIYGLDIKNLDAMRERRS
ncbi:MAG: hypothetical protein U1E49_20365 [Hyphomicrobiaceae bacterium]